MLYAVYLQNGNLRSPNSCSIALRERALPAFAALNNKWHYLSQWFILELDIDQGSIDNWLNH
jgi:hypothetical protein